MKKNKIKISKENTIKWPKILIALLSTIGVVDTGSITLKNWGLFSSLSCPEGNGCDAVLNSPWGTLYSNNQITVPLSLAGLITYSLILLVIITLTLKIFPTKEKLSKTLWWFL